MTTLNQNGALMKEIEIRDFKRKFDREAVHLMRDNKVPGMSILITKKQEVFYERAYGSREWQGGKPASLDTLYGIASITKSMTCVGILQLHQEGKLNIYDPISKYVPLTIGFEEDPITIHHLMCHASGIPSLSDYVFPIINEELFVGGIPNFPMGNWDDFWFHMNDAKKEVLNAPRKKFYYFNGGFTILSQIISKVAGVSYEQYMREKIFSPLGMKRSTFSRDELEKDKDASRAYGEETQKKKLKRIPKPHLSGPFNSGAGGLNSTVRELTNYLLFHLNNGSFNGNQILKEDLILEMRKPHNTNLTGRNFLLHRGKSAYGYGWGVVENYHGYTLITHSGSSGVSGGYIGFIPELEVTYAQLYNIGWLPRHLIDYAFLLLMGKEPDKELPFIERRDFFEKIVGKYEAYKKTVKMEIVEKAGLLYLEGELIEKFSFPLIPSSEASTPHKFHVVNPYGTMDVEFTFHANGEITFDYERHLMHKVNYKLRNS
ncbi:MAG: serine hydrolase [Candidatus Heimdallarchaeota archaeon]